MALMQVYLLVAFLMWSVALAHVGTQTSAQDSVNEFLRVEQLLGKARSLKSVNCSERHLTAEGVAAIANLPSLDALDWTFPIHDEVVPRLKPLLKK